MGLLGRVYKAINLDLLQIARMADTPVEHLTGVVLDLQDLHHLLRKTLATEIMNLRCLQYQVDQCLQQDTEVPADLALELEDKQGQIQILSRLLMRLESKVALAQRLLTDLSPEPA
ncbi:MAG: hypothetical protein HC921_07070 [Synechococcaceae cyanobacterium SM2_3_1]|nr:hypothetical protein [Synechococcaceae cyanobacterium SM2_3_1]